MDLTSQNQAYRSYVEQAKDALVKGDVSRAKDFFVRAAEITNEIAKNTKNIEVRNEYVRITQMLIDCSKKQCVSSNGVNISTGSVSLNQSNLAQKETKNYISEVEELTLDEALERLNSLIGLESVKTIVKNEVYKQKIFQDRVKEGLKNPKTSYHMVFTGNPGTGKTTVARIIGQIYHALGVLTKGHTVELSRETIIGSYIGKTEENTQKFIADAIGGVLFIDEAYSLAQGGENDFGKNAITAILKAMEDNRDDLIVICAGYDDLMQEFIDSNPGLNSRFRLKIHFDDYLPDEMFKIFEKNCKDNDYQMSEDFEEKIKTYLDFIYTNRDKNFANARDVRNLFDKTVTNQAKRLYGLQNNDKETLKTFVAEDLEV